MAAARDEDVRVVLAHAVARFERFERGRMHLGDARTGTAASRARLRRARAGPRAFRRGAGTARRTRRAAPSARVSGSGAGRRAARASARPRPRRSSPTSRPMPLRADDDLGHRLVDRQHVQDVAVAVAQLERRRRALSSCQSMHALPRARLRHEPQVLRAVAHRRLVDVARGVIDRDSHSAPR